MYVTISMILTKTLFQSAFFFVNGTSSKQVKKVRVCLIGDYGYQLTHKFKKGKKFLV